MATLFEETEINGLPIRNRLIRSATWEGMCTAEGRPTEKLINCYHDLALGGIGLIISGYAYVRPEGQQLPRKMGIHREDFAISYEKMTRAVHDGGGRIAIQLVHAGGQALPDNSGYQPLAPSAIKIGQYNTKPAELTKEQIYDIVNAFGSSARRAKAYGFDGIQLHGAHGYLINEFLSPHTNQRADEYGGSIENRSRFVRQVYEKVRQTVGPDYPVMIKMNCSDNYEGGLTIDDAIYVAEKLSEAGLDAMEVSAGLNVSGEMGPVRLKIDSQEKEGWNISLARQIRTVVKCPVMVVGGFRSYEICDRTIREDGMDFVSMCRPLIREPDLANRWLNGERSPAKCVSCNGCFRPGIEESGIYCVMDRKERERSNRG